MISQRRLPGILGPLTAVLTSVAAPLVAVSAPAHAAAVSTWITVNEWDVSGF